MELSQILYFAFGALLVALLLTWIIFATLRPKGIESLTPKTGPLHNPTRVGLPTQPRDLFLVPAGGTFSVYLFAAVNNKTPSFGNVQTPINLFQMGETLKFQLVPGGVESSPKTQLIVRTQGPTPESSVETLEVAPFPQQTWVHVVLVREGRRYTVYYNGKVVSSMRTMYVPSVNTAYLTLGDSRLQGKYGLAKLTPTPYQLQDVQTELQETSDTRHEPYLAGFWPAFDPSALQLGCPNGVFCFSTAGNPVVTPLTKWTSPYA